MRNHTTPIYKDLQANSNDSVSITPGAATQPGTFQIQSIPGVTGDKRNYATSFYGHLQTTFDPDAAGNAVNWDKLYKGMASWHLRSPLLGDVYNHVHTRGAVLGHIIQVIAGGYQYPQPARAQIPANTDSDVTLDLFYALPLSFEVLEKPHECAQWVGLFDGGTLEGIVDVSTVYDGDYAGAVIKAPTSLRAFVEMIPSPDDFLGVPFQWRERQIVGGGTSPVLKGVGQETNLTDVENGCGLAFLGWLTDATGIGLSGADGVDNITQVEMPWRGQIQLRNLDPLFLALRKAQSHRVGPVAGLGTTIIADGAGWPYTMADTPNNRPAASSQSLFLPLVIPGRNFETSKAQRLLGDLQVNFTTTAAITNTHRFVSWELMEFTEGQVGRLARAMGIDPALYDAGRKAFNQAAPASKLRYTRIMFSPKPEAVAAAR